MIIENKLSRGVAVTCTKLSQDLTFIDQKSQGLENKDMLVMKVSRDMVTREYPFIKCVAIWSPDSVGFAAFNVKNALATNNRIQLRSDKTAVLIKDNEEVQLEQF